MSDPEDCDHENRTYDGTDTEAAPEIIYREYWCEDCGSFVSEVYKHAGHRIVQTAGDAWEEEVE